MSDPFSDQFLDSVRDSFTLYRRLSESALDQLADDQLFAVPAAGDNSAAVLVKHLAGNLRSRWRDFLTTDGEKADRHRDREFSIGPDDSRESLMDRWAEGWRILETTLAGLTAADLTATVTIRGQPHTVAEAIHRQLGHTAYHAGQIVQLARRHRGDSWRTLSVPPGGSEEHNRRMREKWGQWDGGG